MGGIGAIVGVVRVNFQLSGPNDKRYSGMGDAMPAWAKREGPELLSLFCALHCTVRI